MKRILLAGALALAAGGQALAADLPQPGPPPPRAPATYVPAPVPVFSWTGVYLGVNGGYGLNDSNWSDAVSGATGNFSTDGFLVGGTVGANYQWGGLVLGIEGDWDWTNLKGTTFSAAGSCNPGGGFAGGCTTQSTWLATARGRAGWAFDRFLVYGTGGGAFGNLQASYSGLPFSSSTQVGWTAGAGVEFAFTPNLTAKVEYLYVDLGSQSCPAASCGSYTAGGAPVSTNVSLTENIVRAGLNFKFNPW